MWKKWVILAIFFLCTTETIITLQDDKDYRQNVPPKIEYIATHHNQIVLQQVSIPLKEQLIINKIPIQYQKTIIDIHNLYSIPYKVMYNLVVSESSWNPYALHYNKESNTQDIGIMQINSKYQKQHVVAFYGAEHEFDPYDPITSLWVGFYYLYTLYTETQSWYLSVCAYKSGIGSVHLNHVPIWVQEVAYFVTTSDPTSKL